MAFPLKPIILSILATITIYILTLQLNNISTVYQGLNFKNSENEPFLSNIHQIKSSLLNDQLVLNSLDKYRAVNTILSNNEQNKINENQQNIYLDYLKSLTIVENVAPICNRIINNDLGNSEEIALKLSSLERGSAVKMNKKLKEENKDLSKVERLFDDLSFGDYLSYEQYRVFLEYLDQKMAWFLYYFGYLIFTANFFMVLVYFLPTYLFILLHYTPTLH